MFLWEALADTLRRYPELAIFLTVGVGFWIGSVRFGSINLGAVTGALFAGLVIGQLEIADIADGEVGALPAVPVRQRLCRGSAIPEGPEARWI